MKRSRITSRCECQALLVAILDEPRHVVEGYAQRLGVQENAPAHSIHTDTVHVRDDERFDVGWLCPFCGRNTLRTFHVGAIRAVGPA